MVRFHHHRFFVRLGVVVFEKLDVTRVERWMLEDREVGRLGDGRVLLRGGGDWRVVKGNENGNKTEML